MSSKTDNKYRIIRNHINFNLNYFMSPVSIFISSEAATLIRSVKKFLKISQNSQEDICFGAFFNKVAGFRPKTLLKKEAQTQVFS